MLHQVLGKTNEFEIDKNINGTFMVGRRSLSCTTELVFSD
jgi:hypothetical protein